MTRRRHLLLTALVTGGSFGVAAPAHGQAVAGVVVDSDGRPVAGVTANALMGDAAVTGAVGRFELKEAWPTVRFVADGYRPLTRPTATVRANPTVVLERTSTAPTLLPSALRIGQGRASAICGCPGFPAPSTHVAPTTTM